MKVQILWKVQILRYKGKMKIIRRIPWNSSLTVLCEIIPVKEIFVLTYHSLQDLEIV